MKNLYFYFGILLLIFNTKLHASEVENIDRNFGIGITDDRGLKFMFPISPDYNINTDFWYSKRTNSNKFGNFEVFGVSIGSRKFLSKNNTNRTFFDFDVSFSFTNTSGSDSTEVEYAPFLGFEVLLQDNFGIEGKAGVSFQSRSLDTSRYYKYPVTSVSVNYYFD